MDNVEHPQRRAVVMEKVWFTLTARTNLATLAIEGHKLEGKGTRRNTLRPFNTLLCHRFGPVGMAPAKSRYAPSGQTVATGRGLYIYSENEIRIQLSIRLFSSCDPLRVAHGTEQNLGRH